MATYPITMSGLRKISCACADTLETSAHSVAKKTRILPAFISVEPAVTVSGLTMALKKEKALSAQYSKRSQLASIIRYAVQPLLSVKGFGTSRGNH